MIMRHVSATALILSACGLALIVTPARILSAERAGEPSQSTAATTLSGEPLDINTATRAQLKALPGMGEAYADRIIRGRPYTAKNQLTQRGIIPDAAYSKIQALIIARRPR